MVGPEGPLFFFLFSMLKKCGTNALPHQKPWLYIAFVPPNRTKISAFKYAAKQGLKLCRVDILKFVGRDDFAISLKADGLRRIDFGRREIGTNSSADRLIITFFAEFVEIERVLVNECHLWVSRRPKKLEITRGDGHRLLRSLTSTKS